MHPKSTFCAKLHWKSCSFSTCLLRFCRQLPAVLNIILILTSKKFEKIKNEKFKKSIQENLKKKSNSDENYVKFMHLEIGTDFGRNLSKNQVFLFKRAADARASSPLGPSWSRFLYAPRYHNLWKKNWKKIEKKIDKKIENSLNFAKILWKNKIIMLILTKI